MAYIVNKVSNNYQKNKLYITQEGRTWLNIRWHINPRVNPITNHKSSTIGKKTRRKSVGPTIYKAKFFSMLLILFYFYLFTSQQHLSL